MPVSRNLRCSFWSFFFIYVSSWWDIVSLYWKLRFSQDRNSAPVRGMTEYGPHCIHSISWRAPGTLHEVAFWSTWCCNCVERFRIVTALWCGSAAFYEHLLFWGVTQVVVLECFDPSRWDLQLASKRRWLSTNLIRVTSQQSETITPLRKPEIKRMSKSKLYSCCNNRYEIGLSLLTDISCGFVFRIQLAVIKSILDIFLVPDPLNIMLSL